MMSYSYFGDSMSNFIPGKNILPTNVDDLL